MKKRTRTAFTPNLSDNAFYSVKWWFAGAGAGAGVNLE